MYQDGIVRLASQKYDSDSSKGFDDPFVHLTNYSLNKQSSNFQNNTDAAKDDEGSKQSITAFRKKLRKMGLNDHLLFCKSLLQSP